MEDTKYSGRRVVRYRDAMGKIKSSYGVHDVTDKGVVLVVARTRILIPWNNVIDFSYDVQDVKARKIVQGY